jgi:hypothetical protein
MHLTCEDDISSCCQKLLESPVFTENKAYVRTQIIYSLLQEDERGPLHVIGSFLLMDGNSDEDTFRRMVDEGCFARLLELINTGRHHDWRLRRLLLELMYEMSRIECLPIGDLLQVDDNFVLYLFELIEAISDDVDDPYHYPVIRVLLVLNEQYMVAATSAAVHPDSPLTPVTNRVIKVLSIHGPLFRTFGENIILLLNREMETSLQLLILKLLYLLFTTTATYEYFYTNDLRVLLDVIIRNLLDLPNELVSLRHTYLRVLYPLLAHTQLSQPPYYKRDEILKVLNILGGGGSVHFAPADDTTLRLLNRVSKVKWLENEDRHVENGISHKFLGISLSPIETASSVSVVDIARVMEKPGVQTPSRKADPGLEEDEDESARELVETAEQAVDLALGNSTIAERTVVLPEVPKHRHGRPTVPPRGAHRGNRSFEKKTPPKLPPPRRKTKLKSVLAVTDIVTPAEAVRPEASATVT